MRAILQRHGKVIMTVMGIALMFIFALPTFRAPSQDRADMAVGKLNGHKISQDDIDGARAELGFYERMGLPNYAQVDDENERPIYWYLLHEEANRYGEVYVSDSEARDQLTSAGRSDADIDLALKGAGLRSTALGSAISSLETVVNYLQFLESMPRSVASMELSADRELSKIQVAYALLDANKGWDGAATPTEERIKKQFDLYKGVVRTPIPPAPIATTTAPADQPVLPPPPPLPPLIDGHHYPFGYKYPDRVAVDYLVFNRAAVKAGMKLTQEDIDNADKYYFSHPDEFRNKPAAAASSQPATQPATQPAIKPLAEVQDELRGRQIDARVSAVMKKMTDRVLAQAAEPWKAMPIDDKGFRETLKREQWADYSKLAEDISKNRDFGGYKPEVGTSGKTMLDAEGLSALPGIGGAGYHAPNQGQDFTFADLATHVRELVELKAKNPLGRLFLQTGVEVQQPLTDKDGNMYIFRVTTAEKTHEPATEAEVADVRPRVIEDLKKLETYQKLETQAKELAGRVHNAFELSALSEQQKLPEKTTPPFSRLDQSGAPEVAAIRGFVDAAFNLGNGATTQPAGAATQASASAAATAATLENEESLRVFVLQMVSHSPATGSDFGGYRGRLFQESDSGLGAFLRSYLSLDSIAARVKFVPTQPFSKPKADE